MTLQQIQDSVLDDFFIEVVYRLIDLSELPEGAFPYTLIDQNEQESLSMYERLELHPSLEKPTLQELEDEFAVLKAEMIVAEEARLAEVARIEDLKSRWSAMDDKMPAFLQVVPDTPNSEAYFRDHILGESDKALAESRLAAIEAKHAEVSQAKAVEEQKRQLKSQGAKDRALCQEVLDLIAGINRDRALTIEQISQMQSIFSDAEAALRAGRPDLAKSLIQAIEPDEELVTQQMKDWALEILA